MKVSDFRGSRVLITGNTGFKGSWLAEWLIGHGADVYGYALNPEWEKSLFETRRHAERMNHTAGDIRDIDHLKRVMQKAQPEWVFHLAAQPLVRRSYREPILTWETNVMGTLNLLEGLRTIPTPRAVVIVTTDKVYRNTESPHGYKETDELGGHDPYAASKAACELVVASWRESYGEKAGIRVATARAGNVLGGGDWSADRIVPDCFRAWRKTEKVKLRHPQATRPWQHVLEPLSGYLTLAQALAKGQNAPSAVNFGPSEDALIPVGTLVDHIAKITGGVGWEVESPSTTSSLHETTYLALNTSLARQRLGWRPKLTVDQLIEWTSQGYGLSGERDAANDAAYVETQIADYEALEHKTGLKKQFDE